MTNYLVGFTSNFGVVPLFLFWDFLFCPTFFFLFLRTTLVFAVRDAITTNLLLTINPCGRLGLSKLRPLVNLVLFLNVFIIAHASDEISTIYLHSGELKTISAPYIKRFTFSDKEVVRYKRPDKNKLIVKGHRTGSTDLIIWGQDSQHHYKIFVLSRSGHLKILNLAQHIHSLGANTQIEGDSIWVTGTLTDTKKWNILGRMGKNNPSLIFNVDLDQNTLNNAVSEIYSSMLNAGADYIACQFVSPELQCLWSGVDDTIQDQITRLNLKYPIVFQKLSNSALDTNYEAKLRIIKIEKQQSRDLSLGLDKIDSSIDEFISSKGQSLIGKNQIRLKENDYVIQTLAEPRIVLNLSKSALVEIGADIPYHNYSVQNAAVTTTQWRFAGLKIDLNLKRKNNQFYVDYQLEFSRPGANSISTSRQSSSIYIETNKTFQLFHIIYQGQDEQDSGIPWIKEIPLLGAIFSSNSKQESTQKIIGIIELKKLKE